MEYERIKSILAFMKNAEQLKNTIRSAHTSAKRPESVAEHTWSICLLILCFEEQLKDVDLLRLLKLIIIHDLGEAVSGDIPAPQQRSDQNKWEQERADFVSLCAPLPANLKVEFVGLWDEYHEARTQEAIMAKGFDKIETMHQHLCDGTSGNIDFEFNLSYGSEQTDAHALLKSIRSVVDEETEKRLN